MIIMYIGKDKNGKAWECSFDSEGYSKRLLKRYQEACVETLENYKCKNILRLETFKGAKIDYI